MKCPNCDADMNVVMQETFGGEVVECLWECFECTYWELR